VACKPLIVGLGGTVRPGSSSERALGYCLRAAERLGAETRLLGGEMLARLPMFDPRPGSSAPEHLALAAAIRAADGVIIASPGYHGSISGAVKNALDALELTRDDVRPYLHDVGVGVIVTADGPQAAGATLMALRAIVHALRGWPTPLGAALTGTKLFDEAGECADDRDALQLDAVAAQTVAFARMSLARAAS
jgi:FMN reductase